MLCDAGNYQHAVVHSTCVLEHQPNNVKALYRRGACQVAPRPPARSAPRTRIRTRTTTCSCGYLAYHILPLSDLTSPHLTSPHLTSPYHVQLRLGYLEKGRADLQLAVKLAPADAEARAELQTCNARLAEYRARKKELSKRMLAGADGGMVEEAAASGEETGALL